MWLTGTSRKKKIDSSRIWSCSVYNIYWERKKKDLCTCILLSILYGSVLWFTRPSRKGWFCQEDLDLDLGYYFLTRGEWACMRITSTGIIKGCVQRDPFLMATNAPINDMPPPWGDMGETWGKWQPSVTFPPYMGCISCVLSPCYPHPPCWVGQQISIKRTRTWIIINNRRGGLQPKVTSPTYGASICWPFHYISPMCSPCGGGE